MAEKNIIKRTFKSKRVSGLKKTHAQLLQKYEDFLGNSKPSDILQKIKSNHLQVDKERPKRSKSKKITKPANKAIQDNPIEVVIPPKSPKSLLNLIQEEDKQFDDNQSSPLSKYTNDAREIRTALKESAVIDKKKRMADFQFNNYYSNIRKPDSGNYQLDGDNDESFKSKSNQQNSQKNGGQNPESDEHNVTKNLEIDQLSDLLNCDEEKNDQRESDREVSNIDCPVQDNFDSKTQSNNCKSICNQNIELWVSIDPKSYHLKNKWKGIKDAVVKKYSEVLEQYEGKQKTSKGNVRICLVDSGIDKKVDVYNKKFGNLKGNFTEVNILEKIEEGLAKFL